MALLTTPTADLALSYTRQLVNGQPATVCDLPLTPSGGAALVAGTDRVRQTIQWALAVPVGGYFALPAWGNQFYTAVGRPTALDDETYLSMAEGIESSLLQAQAVAASQGYVSLDEQIEAFTATTIDRSTPGVVAVGVTVQTRGGATLTVTQPFAD